MKFRADLDARKVVRGLGRIRRRTPVITAQVLNRQRTQSRTKITRGLASAANIKPQKRVRRRVLVKLRGGFASAKKLRADALALFESWPARYWRSGPPPGATISIQAAGAVDRSGRRTVGGSFRATMPNGKVATFRRVQPRRYAGGSGNRSPRSQGGEPPSGLPIRNVEVISLENIGYAVRHKALVELSREFPPEWERRMRREIGRALG